LTSAEKNPKPNPAVWLVSRAVMEEHIPTMHPGLNPTPVVASVPVDVLVVNVPT